MMREFPTLTEVLAMHEILIETFGGTHGIRDQGALESALMRPQLGYYQDIIEEAAALMESLANNHPFLDGNKRIAFFVTDTFLRMNKFYIDSDDLLAHEFFMSLFDTNSFRFEQLAGWLREHVKPLP